jgi:(2R)-3-sulfolactate dehydrogenase (NADP+)
MPQKRLSPDEARALIRRAFLGSGATAANARYFTEAILDTELSGLEGHGFYWLQFYCEHLRSGKVDGKARPGVVGLSPVAFRIDAKGGFAHPAIEAGFRKLVPAARRHGIAAMSIHNSYNAATLGYHTETLARAGLSAFGFTNSTPAIAPFGGAKPLIGTNPMSFAAPGFNADGTPGEPAFVVDQSSSATAWTNVKRASDEKRPIPLGWALDEEGRPTTDADKGLAGSMAPAGGHKGWGQGLIVETMCAAMAGALRGPQMGSFMANDGRMIGCGQFFIAMDPHGFSGGLFAAQVTALSEGVMAQPGARLPNQRRMETRERLAREGLPIDADLLERLEDLGRKP